MDAVQCFEEYDRMCRQFRDCLCQGCGINEKSNGDGCNDYIKSHPEEAVEIIERWSLDHPRPNRQNKLLEAFPSAKVESGVLTFCPTDMDSNFECPAMEELSCLECRKKYWFAEVHE